MTIGMMADKYTAKFKMLVGRTIPETHTCYNCSDKGHVSHVFPKPQKQRIWLADSAEGDIKCIVAKAVAATMDARELANKAEKVKELEKANEDFQPSQW